MLGQTVFVLCVLPLFLTPVLKPLFLTPVLKPELKEKASKDTPRALSVGRNNYKEKKLTKNTLQQLFGHYMV